MTEVSFIFNREPWRRLVGLWIRHQDERAVSLAEPLKFKTVAADGMEVAVEPTLHLTEHEAQGVMDALWAAGFKPSEGHGSVGQLGATERHLADMRTIALDAGRALREVLLKRGVL